MVSGSQIGPQIWPHNAMMRHPLGEQKGVFFSLERVENEFMHLRFYTSSGIEGTIKFIFMNKKKTVPDKRIMQI